MASRLGRTLRDEDQLGPLRSACFAGGLLALGSHAGELRLHDAATGVTVAAADNEHTAAVNLLRAWQVHACATMHPPKQFFCNHQCGAPCWFAPGPLQQ